MAQRPKLTTADEISARARTTGADGGPRKERSEEEKAKHRERITAVKDALKRSATLKGSHVAPARAALKDWLRNPADIGDDRFAILIEAPFREPPKKRVQR